MALSVALGSLAERGTAQVQVEARPPIALVAELTGRGPQTQTDLGRAPKMLQSPNVDRFLRRAQDFLSRDDFAGAIQILQDVVEGRTLIDPAAEAAREDAPDESSGAENPPEDSPGVQGFFEEDSTHAVFSTDERLYRPVQRLCHEMLAALPSAGAAYYRTRFEVAAERAYEAASRAGDPRAFEEVFRRYFLTRTAARAMQDAANLQLDAGRYRAAIRTYGLLLDVYPSEDRAAAGIRDAWLRFKVALCYHLIGDDARARQELAALATDDPGITLRIAGELTSIEELAETGFDAETAPAETRRRDGGIGNLFADAQETLVPLWEQRFADQRPYRPAKASNNDRARFVVFDGQQLAPTPKYNDFRPGLRVAYLDGELAFLDHQRLRIVETLTGRALAETDGRVDVPEPQPGRPRTRIPAYDHCTSQPTILADLAVILVGTDSSRPDGMRAVLETELKAWTLDGKERVWQSSDRTEFHDVTFLASPTPFGDRLLVPTMRKGTYELTCLEARTGELVYRVALHRDGTEFARPITPPAVVREGIAYVLTQAGCLAAVDAHTGSLRWIVRYERLHPLRRIPPVVAQRENDPFRGNYFREEGVEGFAPGELIAHDGMLVFAPVDGRVLHCLDAATGDPIWMLQQHDLKLLLGHDGEDLFALGRDELMCIGLRSGVRKWSASVPAHPSSARWRGRGLVLANTVVVPGDNEIHVRPTTRDGQWRSIPLPGFSLGRDPLEGPFDLYADDVFLTAVYEGGLQVFATAESLARIAEETEDPIRRSVLLAQAGDLGAAIDALDTVRAAATNGAVDDPDGVRPTALQLDVAERMLALTGELALALATRGDAERAVAMLDRSRPRMTNSALLQQWHLARLEVFETLGDLDAVYKEQEALYRIMERGS